MTSGGGTMPEREPREGELTAELGGSAHWRPADTVSPHDTGDTNHRLRQYGVLSGLVVLVVVFAAIVTWSSVERGAEARHSQAAAERACRQVVALGQPCVAAPDLGGQVSNDALVPAPVASRSGVPVAPTSARPGVQVAPAPTDEHGVPQAFQPGPDAEVVSLAVTNGRLVITYDDGARVDAGPVHGDLLSIGLGAAPTPGPSAEPTPEPVDTPPPTPAETTADPSLPDSPSTP